MNQQRSSSLSKIIFLVCSTVSERVERCPKLVYTTKPHELPKGVPGNAASSTSLISLLASCLVLTSLSALAGPLPEGDNDSNLSGTVIFSDAAEEGFTQITDSVSGYSALTDKIYSEEKLHAFRLAPVFVYVNNVAVSPPQTLTLKRPVTPEPTTQLRFKSWIRQNAAVTPRIEYSVNGVDRWLDVPSNLTVSQDTKWEERSASLAGLVPAGQSIYIRFIEQSPSGGYAVTSLDYVSSADGFPSIGWFIDQISIVTGNQIVFSDNAEVGFTQITDSVSGYSALTDKIYSEEKLHAFRLAPVFVYVNNVAVSPPQTLTLKRPVTPEPTMQLRFKSWIRQNAAVTPRIEYSVNGVDRWLDVPSNLTVSQDTKWEERSASLAGLVPEGQSIYIRFIEQSPSGGYAVTSLDYVSSADGFPSIGWFIDQITILSGGIAIDTIAPFVSLETPANGATVLGSAIAVRANASDNVGVAGVRFQLDGADFGAEDTVWPYEVSWNTTLVVNGSHSWTATARDAAGNTTRSNMTSVIINNPTCNPAYGDLNADGNINAVDLVILANFMAGNLTQGPAPFTASQSFADLNRSGAVDAVDLVLMQNFLSGNITCLPF